MTVTHDPCVKVTRRRAARPCWGDTMAVRDDGVADRDGRAGKPIRDSRHLIGMIRPLFAAAALTTFATLREAPDNSQQTSSENDAIIATARDYIDGFSTGDTARMRRALHPDLAKRRIGGQPGSPPNQTANDLVNITARNQGRGGAAQPTPADSIRILDRYRDIAMVRIGAPTWVDYLHVAKFGQEWKIINVAWETRS